MLFKSLQTTCLLGVLAVVAVSANQTIARRALLLPNPPLSSLPVGSRAIIPQLEARALTNAKRLAAGLPLKPPQRRASGTTLARRSSPSGTPVQGYIQAFQVGTDAPQGYISATYNKYNGEATLTTSTDTTQFMVFSLVSGIPGPISIQTTNGPNAAYPYFGGIAPYSSTEASIDSSSSNYAYLAGTVETNPGSDPVNGGSTYTAGTSQAASIESGIWSFDPSTDSITAQWVNPDSSMPTTYIGFTNVYDFLFLTGSETEWAANYGAVIWLYLKFVPI